MEKELDELVQKLRAAAGDNLKSAVLYGSAVRGEFHPKHSDLNVLCVLERLDASGLAKLGPAATWWMRRGHPAPLLFTREALHRAADVFAIELLDIKAGHRVLFGEDVFTTMEVPMGLHRLQVERELRINLIRLRQHFLAARSSPKAVMKLMTESVSSFVALFRHALLALGEQPPDGKRDIVNRLAGLVGFDATAFQTVFDVREGKRHGRNLNVEETFRGYLEGITHVTDEVDRRWAGGNS
jgi:predicted nucleotidyltransferase